MAELTPRERLQPALLDRLTDDEPDRQVESRERRALSMRRLRQGVLRDLSSLLNATNLESVQPDIGNYPYVAKSVVNYGMPDMAGKTASGFRIADLEQSIRQVICDFEPRIVPSSVLVRAIPSRTPGSSYNAIHFEVEGDMWALPFPEHLFLRTEVDLETGAIQISDLGIDATESAGS